MDTVHLWNTGISEAEMNTIAGKLTAAKFFQDKLGVFSVYGYLDNMKVVLKPSFISVKGSLPVFYLGDNIQAFTRSDIERASEKLSDSLCLNMNEARVSRVDMGYNFVTKHRPSAYYPYLLGSKNYYRHSDRSTLYYMNKSSNFCIYDKLIETEYKHKEIPYIYSDKNLIRLEYRALKQPAKQIKQDKLFLKSLYDESIYIKLVDKWADTYHSIRKAPLKINLNKMTISTPKDLQKYLAAIAAQEIGYDSLMAIIEEAKSTQTFKHEKYYQRMKKGMLDLLSVKVEGSSFEMTEELDKQVNQVKQYYR
jgi:hypothetical protein